MYAHNGPVYRSLTAGGGYYLYSRILVSNGSIGFANGNPPPTSPSDTFAMQCFLDGYAGLPAKKITMPAGGGSGSDSGGGSGTCPEYHERVTLRRYDDGGELVFEGLVNAGDVRVGYESDDGAIRRGDFLKGRSFSKNREVFRAVQHYKHVPCSGWMMINGKRVTACEHVWWNGQWLPAWKVPGATHDDYVSVKVEIQVEADAEDEHNYYIGDGDGFDLLIHNQPYWGADGDAKMMAIWVMSKSYRSPQGVLPVAWNYGYNHSAMGYRENGWGLVWLTLDAHQLEFLRSGADPRVEVVGTEWDEPTQLLLDTYRDKLANKPYVTLGQVLAKLGQWEPRFIIDRRPDRP